MKKGFTLVELLVVLVIIGIIVGLILPNALKAINEANERECAANIKSIDTAIQLCYSQTRDFNLCADEAGLTAGPVKYLDSFPVCPFGIGYDFVDSDRGKKINPLTHFAVGSHDHL